MQTRSISSFRAPPLPLIALLGGWPPSMDCLLQVDACAALYAMHADTRIPERALALFLRGPAAFVSCLSISILCPALRTPYSRMASWRMSAVKPVWLLLASQLALQELRLQPVAGCVLLPNLLLLPPLLDILESLSHWSWDVFPLGSG